MGKQMELRGYYILNENLFSLMFTLLLPDVLLSALQFNYKKGDSRSRDLFIMSI